jgi:hypothetical protein
LFPNNISHRENRNNLAAQSKYDWLLLDGDSIITNKNFIRHYIKQINTFDIVYGGRLHPDKCPSNNQKTALEIWSLWKTKVPQNEKKRVFGSALTIPLSKKSCFDTVKFDTNTTKYGHDDTTFLSLESQTFLNAS